MNLLAHALLSEDEIEIRLGNLLADFVKGSDRASMSAAFLEGVRQHQAIDAFTDSHPIVHRSKARIRGYRRVTGILIDVYYDHFLTLRWEQYSAHPLDVFTAQRYAEFSSRLLTLPGQGQAILERLMAEDWLGSYGSIEGVEDTLERISERLMARVGKDFELGNASGELIANFEELQGDFTEFFPQLQDHMSAGRPGRFVGSKLP